jgi:hypothetical protein
MSARPRLLRAASWRAVNLGLAVSLGLAVNLGLADSLDLHSLGLAQPFSEEKMALTVEIHGLGRAFSNLF